MKIADSIDEYENNGDLQWNSFRDYLDGYKTLIFYSIDNFDKNKNIVIPLNFLIAHFIELEIKFLNLIWGTSPNEGYTIRSLGLNRNHSIQRLIEDSVDEWYDADISVVEIIRVKQLVNYFEGFSTNKSLSESMRYPVDVDGNIIINLEKINSVKNFTFEEYENNIRNLINLFEILEIKHFLYNISLFRNLLEAIKVKGFTVNNTISELDEMCIFYNSLIKIKRELDK